MTGKSWMIYGASGYTGVLLCEEAVRRGHKPVVAGRSAEKIVPLAERLGLSYVVVSLNDEENLAKILAGFDLVLHAAGPFIYTSVPMVRTCLRAGTNYLDITGEIAVFEHTLSCDQEARQKGIALISGVGFGVIPTDCMAKYIADRVPDATQLELAIATTGSPSAGTIKTILEQFPKGTLIRRQGKLVRQPTGHGARRIRFVDDDYAVLPTTWGDLVTAYRSTGIPNITTYMAFPEKMVPIIRWIAPPSQVLLAIRPVRRLMQKWAEKTVRGPNEHTRQTARAYVWARAANDGGGEVQAWLDAPEGYHFTALAGVRAVERVFEERPRGAVTPAQAFGADFVLEIPGTKRYDHLPDM